MARASRKQMADIRAMAIEHERTELDGRRPDSSSGLIGGGATPSMGLSPYWGGNLPMENRLTDLPYYRHQAMEPLEEYVNHPPEVYVGGSAVQPGHMDYPVRLMADNPPYFRHGAMEPLEENVNHPPELFVGGYRDDQPLPMASGSLKRMKGGAKHPKLGNSEAFTMGHHLGKHLHALHGGDFYGDFAKGYGEANGGHESGEYDGKGFTPSEIRKAKRLAKLHGGAWYDFLDPAKNGLNASVADTKAKFEEAGKKIKNEFENPSSKLRKVADPVIAKVKNEFENPESKLRGDILPKIGYELGNPDSDFNKGVSQYIEPVVNAVAPGLGSVSKKAFDAMNEGKRKAGLGKSTVEDYKRLVNGPKKGKGMKKMLGEAGRGRRAEARDERPRVMPVVEEKPKRMCGAGTAKRAEIVKRVMAEKGLKMIEASKYVKAHGLY